MINLPNGCRCSQPSGYPKNWNSTTAKTKMGWYVSYRFYDPNFPKPKLVVIKGMNQFKALQERQTATKRLLEQEISKLVNQAFNPLSEKIKPQSPRETKNIY